MKRRTDFETDDIHEVGDLHNTTEGECKFTWGWNKKTETHGNLNESFEAIGISPMKFHGIP